VMESIFIGEVSELNSVVWVLALAGPRLFNLRVCQLCGLISGLLSRCEWEGAIIENVRPVWSHCESMVSLFNLILCRLCAHSDLLSSWESATENIQGVVSLRIDSQSFQFDIVPTVWSHSDLRSSWESATENVHKRCGLIAN